MHRQETVLTSTRTRTFFFVCIAVSILVGSYVFLLQENETPVHDQEPKAQLERTIAFNLAVTNTSDRLQKNTEVLVYAPNKKTAVQQGGRISSNYPYTTQIDSLNNHILHFTFETIPPFGTKIINLSAKVDFMVPPQKVTLKDRNLFLSEERFVEISSAELRQLAEQFSSETQLQSVKKIYTWIASSISPMPYSSRERGALYALRKKKGDCTEFMNLFIALCRLNTIPACGVSGFIVPQDKRVQANDFHDWAEVYLDGTWRLVDPFNGVFLDKEDEYLAMYVHDPLASQADFHRWKSDNKNIKITIIQ